MFLGGRSFDEIFFPIKNINIYSTNRTNKSEASMKPNLRLTLSSNIVLSIAKGNLSNGKIYQEIDEFVVIKKKVSKHMIYNII